MASTYKTPGVYVEEISLFPPSVAQVETAVPAFIGYTEKAFRNGESLTSKPTLIYSLSEYEAWFGVGPNVSYNVHLDTNDAITHVIPSQTFFLYESLRMFYENGGGKCYIISVGAYGGGAANITDLKGGLGPLEKEDEPTLIVCPDAVLTDDGLYDFQQAALLQSARLGDRFVICDLKKSDDLVALQSKVSEFRNKIGINNLKYGAAYAPYVYSSLPKIIKYRNLNLFRGAPPGTALTLDALTSDNNAIQLIYDLGNAKKAGDTLKGYIAVGAPGILTGTSKSFEEEFKKLFDNYATDLPANKLARLKDLFNFIQKILVTLNTFQGAQPAKVASTPNPASKTSSVAFVLKDDVTGIVGSSGAKTVFQTLIKHSNAAKAALAGDEFFTAGADLTTAQTFLGLVPADYATTIDAALNVAYAAMTSAQRYDEGKKAVSAAFTSFISLFYAVQAAAAGYENTLDTSLSNSLGIYKSILSKVSVSTSQLPPSGTVAGIYALVDDQRGVWKAPANVSLNSVVGPVVQIDNAQQDDMNVDVNAGKSVNAIRAFTGKGTLIWGARTLAGNDNEWRYVSVRRFFNMVEESVKKASGQFVFEPNDANTWVKVKGMIENYLTVLWRQGALAGAKAEQAFFVKVGLGQTMTAQDILEGKMNIEIGMAAVRPAEFIILKFSHKMQES
jgi:hypothetical protein